MAKPILVNFQSKNPAGRVMGGSVIIAAVDEADGFINGHAVVARMIPDDFKDHIEIVTVVEVPERQVMVDARGKRYMFITNLISMDSKVEGEPE